MKEHWKAIPTTYNGHEFRSRLEANMALALDRLSIRWEYEAKSFLLPDGTHYRPDFWLPDLRIWFETRGYTNEKGMRQLEGFPEVIEPDQAFIYAIVSDTTHPHAFVKWTISRKRNHKGYPFGAVYELTDQLDRALCEMGYCPLCADPERYEQEYADAYHAAALADQVLWDAGERRPRLGRLYADLGPDIGVPIYCEHPELPLRSEAKVINSFVHAPVAEPQKVA